MNSEMWKQGDICEKSDQHNEKLKRELSGRKPSAVSINGGSQKAVEINSNGATDQVKKLDCSVQKLHCILKIPGLNLL